MANCYIFTFRRIFILTIQYKPPLLSYNFINFISVCVYFILFHFHFFFHYIFHFLTEVNFKSILFLCVKLTHTLIQRKTIFFKFLYQTSLKATCSFMKYPHYCARCQTKIKPSCFVFIVVVISCKYKFSFSFCFCYCCCIFHVFAFCYLLSLFLVSHKSVVL